MAKKDVIQSVERALSRAKIAGAKISAESLSRLGNSGFRRSGYRVSAELPSLTTEQRQALYAAVDGSLALHVGYCPMSGRIQTLWTEG